MLLLRRDDGVPCALWQLASHWQLLMCCLPPPRPACLPALQALPEVAGCEAKLRMEGEWVRE